MHYLLLLIILLAGCNKPSQSNTQKKSKFVSHELVRGPQSKSRGYFQINITEEPATPDSLTLVAIVTANQDFQDVEMQWNLPANSEIYAGDSQRFLDIGINETMEFRITLNRSSLNDGDAIVFSISKVLDNENHGGTASFLYKLDKVETQSVQQKPSLDKKIME